MSSTLDQTKYFVCIKDMVDSEYNLINDSISGQLDSDNVKQAIIRKALSETP